MGEEEFTSSLEKEARGKLRKGVQRVEAPASAGGALEAEQALRAADQQVLLRRLAGKPSSEILSRISNGDPLQLYSLGAQRIRDTFYILDPDRVFERLLAEVAVGMELEGEKCLDSGWFLERVDLAIQSVLERDRAEEREGLPLESPREHFRLFVEAFFIEPPLARLSSVRFNGLEERIRKGFQKLMIEALPLEEVLAMDLGPPERLQLDILLGLQAIGLIDEEGVEELRWKGDKP